MKKNDSSSMTCEQIQNIWSSEPEVLGILDLRSDREFQEKHIPGSKNVNVANLRKEVAALEDKLAVLICPNELIASVDQALAGKSNYVFMSGCDKWFQSLSATDGDCLSESSGRSVCITMNNNIPEIHVDEVLRSLGKVRLIDVRRPDEFNAELGHIQGAELITLGEELTKFIKNTFNKNEEIIFICRSGKRSETATSEALQSGFSRVANMVGGMLLWNEKKYFVTRK